VILGETGHQELTDPSGWRRLRSLLAVELDQVPAPLVGITSLAAGADQLFAQQVLTRGGELHVVVPFPDYGDLFSGVDRTRYRRLLRAAADAVVLPRSGSDEDCYMAAGQYIVDHCECLVAIWDGRPARGLGGTADVVGYALRRAVPVRRVDASPWRT
jgi:hypothetical protein